MVPDETVSMSFVGDGNWPKLNPTSTGIASRCSRCGKGEFSDDFLKPAEWLRSLRPFI